MLESTSSGQSNNYGNDDGGGYNTGDDSYGDDDDSLCTNANAGSGLSGSGAGPTVVVNGGGGMSVGDRDETCNQENNVPMGGSNEVSQTNNGRVRRQNMMGYTENQGAGGNDNGGTDPYTNGGGYNTGGGSSDATVQCYVQDFNKGTCVNPTQ